MSERTNQTDKNAAKKAAVLGSGKKSKGPVVIAAVLATALAVAGGYALWGRGDREASPMVAATTVSAAQGQEEFSFPISEFADGLAKFYTYSDPTGIAIRYFIVKSSDGVIRAAFDACDTCWPAGKGYSQEGDFMVCKNCGLKFATARVNEVKGGCNPSPLTRAIEGDRVIIKVRDLVGEGARYFDFKGGGRP